MKSESKNQEVATKSFPLTLNSLVDKLIILEDFYRQASLKVADTLLKEQTKRLAIEKAISIKDFSNVQNFKITEHLRQYGDRIGIERKNLYIKFNHLFLEENVRGVINFFIDLENELKDEYHHFFDERSIDDFTLMVLKNQLDETKRSVNELDDIRKTYNPKNK